MLRYPNNVAKRQAKLLYISGRVVDFVGVGLSAHVRLTIENRENQGSPLQLSDCETMVDTGFTGEMVINDEIARALGIPAPAAPNLQNQAIISLWRKWFARNDAKPQERAEAEKDPEVTKIIFGDGSFGFYKVHPIWIFCRENGGAETAVQVFAVVIPKKNEAQFHEAVLGMEALYKCSLNLFVEPGAAFTISSSMPNKPI